MKTLVPVLVLTLVCVTAFALETDPIPGADVKVGKKPPGGNNVIADGTTDALGSVTFNDLPNGTFFVRFTVAGTTYEVFESDAGDKIGVEAATAAADQRTHTIRLNRTSRSVAKPIVYTKTVDGIVTTVEVLGNSFKVTIAKQKNAAQTTKR